MCFFVDKINMNGERKGRFRRLTEADVKMRRHGVVRRTEYGRQWCVIGVVYHDFVTHLDAHEEEIACAGARAKIVEGQEVCHRGTM